MGEVRELFGGGRRPSPADVQAALERMPDEVLIDGPPPVGDLLLQRTLRRLRAERAGVERP